MRGRAGAPHDGEHGDEYASDEGGRRGNYPFFFASFSARFSFVVLAGFFLVSLRESWLLAMGYAPL